MPAALYANGPSTGLGVTIINASSAAIKAILERSAQVVNSTSTALTLTATQHASRLLYWKPNSSGAATATLPVASGSGDVYNLVNALAQTQGSLVLTARTGDTIAGKAIALDTTAAADASVFLTTATSIKATLNRTTQGGLGYDKFIVRDVAANVWYVEAETVGSGTLATPFSA